ncbi:MAG: DNA recombination protein RmuC [Microthrixaceae bacterium]
MTAEVLIIGLLVVGLGVATAAAALLLAHARSALDAERRAGAEAVAQAVQRETQLQVELARAQSSAGTGAQQLDAFKAASNEALAWQSQQFVRLAEAKYGTLQAHSDTVLTSHSQQVDAGLKSLAERLALLEQERTRSTVELKTMVDELSRVTAATRDEASKLASAMSDNRVRGTWGEVQLRRALELAGLGRHVDFVEQEGVTDGSSSGRPDVVVKLPNDRCVVIDSKVPLNRYMEAVNTSDPAAERALQLEHAKAVTGHVKALAGRDYANLRPGSIDLVLMFLPGEPFLSAALDADPTLFESAAAKGIYLVTPSSLIPLLRGIALGWRERQSEQAAAEIHQLGVELHERIAVFAEHYAKVGAQLGRTVDAFNTSVGSLDSRVLSTARKLSEHGSGSTRALPETPQIESTPRRLKTLGIGEPSSPATPSGIGAGETRADAVPTLTDASGL